MSSIRLADVAFAYPQQISLINSCTLDLASGWTGIVGGNGEGKTTLFDLIDGTRRPSSGHVDTGGLRLARCHQSVAESSDVEEFAHDWTPDAMKWRSLLQLDPADFWRWDELSPGMRRRWQIGAALSGEPGVLLLDEPTNHLDTDGRELLCGALAQFNGIGLAVSHDRAFLDEVTDRTVRVHRGAVRVYPGSYSRARPLWEEEARKRLEELETAQEAERALRAELARRSHEHASSVRSLSSASRMKSVRDSDARSVAAKGRARRAEASLARDRSVARSKLQRVRDQLDELPRPESSGGEIFIDDDRCPRDFAIRFETDALTVGERVLATDVKLCLRRDERRWLQGPNGCGKTTLIQAALRACDLRADRVLFVGQRLAREGLVGQLGALSPEDHSRALQIAATLGLDVEAVLDGTALSPGELRKLALGLGLVRRPWLVVLDEPTNDLDVESIERLESALEAYDGALLLVTHDRYFAAELEARPYRPFDHGQADSSPE